MERDSRRRVLRDFRGRVFPGGPALCQDEFIRVVTEPRQRSVYTVKLEACDRIASYIRCCEVGRFLATRDAIYTSSGSKSAAFFSRHVKILRENK